MNTRCPGCHWLKKLACFNQTYLMVAMFGWTVTFWKSFNCFTCTDIYLITRDAWKFIIGNLTVDFVQQHSLNLWGLYFWKNDVLIILSISVSSGVSNSFVCCPVPYPLQFLSLELDPNCEISYRLDPDLLVIVAMVIPAAPRASVGSGSYHCYLLHFILVKLVPSGTLYLGIWWRGELLMTQLCRPCLTLLH